MCLFSTKRGCDTMTTNCDIKTKMGFLALISGTFFMCNIYCIIKGLFVGYCKGIVCGGVVDRSHCMWWGSMEQIRM